MSGEQTFDTVDTPARDRRDWPSFGDFRYPKVILKWRDIPTGIYKVLEVFDWGHNGYGRSLVLKREHENRSIVFVWAPTYVVFALEQNKETKYIWSIGVKVSGNGNTLFTYSHACILPFARLCC